ncbi:MAG: tRNA (N6-threonylcarbamoyladenosine(37)-N6)-methyltransferase TrmO, partial [Ruminococcus sp.]|nr:tRNA (N6-threonylcarbamoyladenosine(37)-N6)-methyltransferase TrmO [Ruminococcus sp.]
EIPSPVADLFSAEQLSALREVLSYDPRPGYQSDPDRVYGFSYAGYDVRFRVTNDAVAVTEAIPFDNRK